jgi:hypothetical protein
MKYYKLANPKIISKLEKMDKRDREVSVGMLIKKNREFANALEKAFTDIIEEFITVNMIDSEIDIISIKKDAVFIKNKNIKYNEFGNGDVKFIKKNSYTGCILIPNYEFYYAKDKIDVKGLSDEVLPLHQDGTLAFISTLMQESNNWNELNQFMKEYSYAYKMRELPFNAYREFTSSSKFRVNMFGNELMMDEIDEEMIESTDISYNYIKIFLPTLKAIAK